VSDRELLELAAKAAGIGGGWEWPRGAKAATFYRDASGKAWNPLTDGDDALRLALTLNLTIRVLEKCVFVETNPETLLGQSQYSALEMYVNGDKYAATCRAIVCVAAAIAEQMKGEGE
jgi:hypothetical protein